MTSPTVATTDKPRARGSRAGWSVHLLVSALALTTATVVLVDAQDATPLYRQANAPIDARVTDLLGRMTLEEKVAQLVGIWNRKREIQDAQGRFDPTHAQALIGFGIGEVSRPSEIAGPADGRPVRDARDHAVFVNAVQKWLIENTRLGIPALFHEEALHGLAVPGAPISPCRSDWRAPGIPHSSSG